MTCIVADISVAKEAKPMNWTVCLYFAILTIVIAFLLWAHVLNKRASFHTNSKSIYYLIGGVFISATILFIPLYYDEYLASDGKTMHYMLSSIHHAFQIFTIDADREIIRRCYSLFDNHFATLYASLLSMEYIVAPILTLSFIVSLFKNAFSHFRYLFGFFSDKYIFSEINDKSLTLAKSISTNHPKALIMFTGVDKQEDLQYREKNEIHALYFQKDILDVSFFPHWNLKRLHIFFISEDQTVNSMKAVELIDKLVKKRTSYSYHCSQQNRIRKLMQSLHQIHISLFVFSTQNESELLLNSAAKTVPETEDVFIRRINDVQSLVYSNLYDNFGNIFEKAKSQHIGDEIIPISTVIVGLGLHGSEMVKALSWYCQMEGYCVSIDAFDSDPNALEKFSQQCPELLDKRYNGDMTPGEANYWIDIHSGVNVDTREFSNYISKLNKTCYVLVCLGNDELNIRISVMLRMLFERIGVHPIIQSIVYNAEIVKTVKKVGGLYNYEGLPYDIDLIGDIDLLYDEDLIINSSLQNLAQKSHNKWAKDDTQKKRFMKYEYYYRSSCASVIHAQARQICNIDPSNMEQNAILEHKRWNAYMRSEGYVYSGHIEKRKLDSIAKMHHDLLPYDELHSESKTKDLSIVNNEHQ